MVNAIHNGPVLAVQTDRSVDESTALVVTNTATDNDIPYPVLTYRLVNAPYGAQIDAHGVITWTPNEYQGPGSYLIQTVVTDDGDPALSATNRFKVTVNEVNTPPTLPLWTDGVMTSGQTLSLYNMASDMDRPLNSLTYELIEAPAGAVIGDDGLITWTPAPDQVPSTNRFTMVATDYSPSALTDQHLSATNSFTIRVFEPGVPPVIVSLTFSNDIATISWSAVAGKSYRLQYKRHPGGHYLERCGARRNGHRIHCHHDRLSPELVHAILSDPAGAVTCVRRQLNLASVPGCCCPVPRALPHDGAPRAAWTVRSSRESG